MMCLKLLVLFLLSVIPHIDSGVHTVLTHQELAELLDDVWYWKLREHPEFATLVGVHTYDALLTSYDIASYKRRNDEAMEYLYRAESMDGFVYNVDEGRYLKLVTEQLKVFTDSYKYRTFLNPVSFLSGPHLSLVRAVLSMNMTSIEDYQNLMSRYNQVYNQIQEVIDLMHISIREQRTNHKVSMERVLLQLRDLDVSVEDSIFYRAVTPIPSTVSGSDARQILSLLKENVAFVLENFRALAKFIKMEYIPKSRGSISMSSLPQGDYIYRKHLEYYTSTKLSPEEIHSRGLEEIDRIQEELNKIIHHMFFELSLEDFSDWMRYNQELGMSTLTKFKSTIEDILEKISCEIFLVVNNFTHESLPIYQSTSEVLGEEVGYYDPGPPPQLVVNKDRITTLRKYDLISWLLHMTTPGYRTLFNYMDKFHFPHLFIHIPPAGVLQPPFSFPDFPAFTAGWGQYAEGLGYDMLLYKTDFEKYGYLSRDMFRSSALVVDTGIHAFNWSRSQAIEFLEEHTAATMDFITDEVDRYITWPGSGTAYKIGEMEIQRLRNKTEELYNAEFQLRDFHDVILQCPGRLDMLEECWHGHYFGATAYYAWSGILGECREWTTWFVTVFVLVWLLT